jgi:hypothetical protein
MSLNTKELIGLVKAQLVQTTDGLKNYNITRGFFVYELTKI